MLFGCWLIFFLNLFLSLLELFSFILTIFYLDFYDVLEYVLAVLTL